MLLKPEGNILTFLNCIGLQEYDNAISRLISIIDTPFVREEVCYLEPEVIYSFYLGGCQFSFNQNGILEAIFIYIKPKNLFHNFQLKNNFINGISPNSSKEDIIYAMNPLFGSPERICTTNNAGLGYDEYHYIRYKIDNKFIHFEFLEDFKLNLITLFIE